MGRISEESIQRVAEANDIVMVINAYFPLKRAGSVYKALCPFHNEKTPSFTVSPQRQAYYCFGCQSGGSVFRFLMDYEHIDFPSAVRKLADRAGIALIEETLSPADEKRRSLREDLLKLHREAAEWFQSNLMKKKFAQPARNYLKSREIHSLTAKEWQLGYAPASWDALLNWAQHLGFNRSVLLQSGLCKLRDENNPNSTLYDRFRNRVIFPICNDLGEVIAFSGRTLESESKEAKYINSPETPIFTKGAVLFGLHKTKRAIIHAGEAIVLEGQIDLISAYSAGIQNVLAPQGTAFTDKQARILRRYASRVVLCFDSDSAGQKAAERSLSALLEYGLTVRCAAMPKGEDPDSMIRRQGAEAFRQIVNAARDFFDYQLELKLADPALNTVQGRLEIARQMAALVGLVSGSAPTMVDRELIIKNVLSKLGLAGDDFRKLIPQSRPHTEFSEPPLEGTPEVDSLPKRSLSTALRLLCLLTLRNKEARDYLLKQDWRAVLGQIEDGDLLADILEHAPDPEVPAAVSAYLASLNSRDQALLSGLLHEKKLPKNPLALAQRNWGDLQETLRKRIVERERKQKEVERKQALRRSAGSE